MKLRDLPKRLRATIRANLKPNKKTPRYRGASKLEGDFKFKWKVIEGPALVREFRFHRDRNWRFDFAFIGKNVNVAIEIEGVTVQGGRHQRIGGFAEDCEKYLQATLLGWQVFRLSKKQITLDNLRCIAKFIRRHEEAEEKEKGIKQYEGVLIGACARPGP